MSTSPTSEPVALFWGDAWWLPGRADPLPVNDPAQVAAALLAALPAGSDRLRLLYEPEGFRTEAVTCPKTNRRTLQWALSDRFPELVEPDRAWSHEPIRARSEGFATLLHLETHPELMRLVDALSEAGLTVTDVWPVPTWLQMLPSDLSNLGDLVAAVVGRDRVCLYHEEADGGRGVERWHGAEALQHCGDWLRHRLAACPDDPVWLVADSPAVRTELEALLPLEDCPDLNVIELPEALARHTVFPSRHPGQMLPPQPRFTGGALLAAASWALLLTTVTWAGVAAWSWHRDQQRETRDLPTLAALRTEVARLQANADAIAQWQALTETVDSGFASDLLAALVRDLPVEIVFDRCEFQASRLWVEGWTAPASTALPAWFAGLKTSHPDWIWALAPGSGGAFRLEGKSS